MTDRRNWLARTLDHTRWLVTEGLLSDQVRPMWYDRMLRPIAATDYERALKARENKHVGVTQIGNICVSTVFLSLDHAMGSGPPVLFETMIFGPPRDGHGFPEAYEVDGLEEMYRYHTEPEAIMGHCIVVARLRLGRELPAARKELA